MQHSMMYPMMYPMMSSLVQSHLLLTKTRDFPSMALASYDQTRQMMKISGTLARNYLAFVSSFTASVLRS